VNSRFRRPARILLLALAVALYAGGRRPAAAQARPASADGIRAAEAAIMRHDVAGAEAGYRQTLSSDTSTARRLAAAVALARLTWRVRHDSSAAQVLLNSASALIPRDITAPLERVRLLLAFGDYPSARKEADKVVTLASSPAERARAISALVAVLVEPILVNPNTAAGVLFLPEVDQAALREVVPLLTAVVRQAPGVLEPARLLVMVGALTGDGTAMLEGWTSYYLIGTDPSKGLLANPARVLSTLLPDWKGPASPLPNRIAVVHALADSRFFEVAALLALVAGDDGVVPGRVDKRAAEIVAYSRFLRQISALADQRYRRTAIGDSGSVEDLRKGMLAAAEDLWPELQWGGTPLPLTWESLPGVVREKFGAVLSLGLTSGYPSLHMGHAVVDEARTVRQHRREAEVRFVSLDAVASNGYQTWAWDGRASTGGWGTATQIVQIRPAYVGDPLAAWRGVADSALRARTTARIAADSSADAERARAEPVAYFASIPARLLRDGRDQLAASLRASGLSGNELETGFKREYASSLQESSVFAHEGRHAIDERHEPGLSSEELEFRAKLSQVVFASHPRLAAVSGIFQENIGDGTPHGQANARVMRGLVGWMRAHAAEIDGLRTGEPLLPQLPQLTDAQLRAAFASMDPLSSRATGNAGYPPRAGLRKD
jgi:hypothetical protein